MFGQKIFYVMKKILVTTVLSLAVMAPAITPAFAQEKLWTLDECMRYAVTYSPKVRQQIYTNNSYHADQLAAVASFLPSITAQSYAQYRFGRAIDPGTNTYVNTTTFNNGYGAYMVIPVFNGGQLINQWRLANMNRHMGRNDLKKQQDDMAVSVMDAFVNAVYYHGTKQMATEKLTESRNTLYRTQRQEELGLKGKADVAQIEATVAADDYNLTHQENLYNAAMMNLKKFMNFPTDSVLMVDTLVTNLNSYPMTQESAADIYNFALDNNPTALQANFQWKASRMNYLISKGKLFPSLSIESGITTQYYENLKNNDGIESFKNQFKNNRGEYVYLVVSFPLFDKLSRITEIRKARNNMRIAFEKQTDTYRQLQADIEQAILDREGFAKEAVQMEKKVEADAFAYKVTLRKFEEGLMSPIDVQTSANTLLTSKADLLQKKLLYIMKSRLVDYYKGQPLINE